MATVGSSAQSAKKRNDLSLKLKYEVVKTVVKEPKIGIRKLAMLFKCGKTQISTILRSKDRIAELYEANASAGMCQTRKGSANPSFRMSMKLSMNGSI